MLEIQTPVLQDSKLDLGHIQPAQQGTSPGRTGSDLEALPASQAKQLLRCYGVILAAAERRNPPRPPPSGSRRRVKQSPVYSLIRHLLNECEQVLCFITDLRVPVDNNWAERDLRMPKVKQQISGGFRTEVGVDFFATIRSYLSTLCKQSADVFQALVLGYQGSPPMPVLG